MHARRLCLLLCVLVFAGASEAGAQWKKHSYPADRFEVEFSDTIQVTPTAINAETKKRVVRATDYMQGGGSYAYMVGAALLRNPVNFDAGVKGSFGKLNCKTITVDRPLTFAGGIAREMRGEDCDGLRAEGRYFATGNWFFQVFYLIQKNGDVASAQHFLHSFKVIGK